MNQEDLTAYLSHYFSDLKQYVDKTLADSKAATKPDDRLFLDGQHLGFFIALDHAKNLLGSYDLTASDVGLDSDDPR